MRAVSATEQFISGLWIWTPSSSQRVNFDEAVGRVVYWWD